jgi:hypothetical protein
MLRSGSQVKGCNSLETKIYMRDFIYNENSDLDDSGMSVNRLLGLVEQSSEGEFLVRDLMDCEKKQLVETLWIFAQLVTMEFDHED